MKAKILVVDDDPDLVELLAFNLKEAGYEVLAASEGREAIAKARDARPDLILLDLQLPDVDGLQVCKTLQLDPNTSAIPIIMLTAKTAESDRVLGLELGAEDYVTKPFSTREIILRIKGLIRRIQQAREQKEEIQCGPLRIDVARHEVTVNGHPVSLTPTEFELVKLLAEREGWVQSREQLLQNVWNYEKGVRTRTVDTHIRRLREKLGVAARLLNTVRGIGYRFRNPQGPAPLPAHLRKK